MTRRQYSSAWPVVLLVVLIGGMWFLVPDSDTNVEDSVAPDPRLVVAIEEALRVDHFMRPRSYTGVLSASRKSQLSFEIPGRLIEVDVDEGALVEAGQRLARLDCQRIEARMASAEAALHQASAVLAELEVGPRAETIATAKADLTSVDADVARLKKDFERSQKLLLSRAISRERFDAAKFQLDAVEARRDAAQKKLDELMAGTRIEQMDAQRATVARLESDVRALKLELEDGELFAPFAGRIADRHLDEGTVVTPGMAAFQIVEDGQLEAWIGLPPESARQLEIGETYIGSIGTLEIGLKLKSLRPTLDEQTRTQNAIFSLTDDSSKLGLVDGQIVRVSIVQRIEADCVALPTPALMPGPRGLWSLFVAVPSQDEVLSNEAAYIIERRDVTLTDTLGDTSFVSGTIQHGERVVVEGAHRVAAGQTVAIVLRERAP